MISGVATFVIWLYMVFSSRIKTVTSLLALTPTLTINAILWPLP